MMDSMLDLRLGQDFSKFSRNMEATRDDSGKTTTLQNQSQPTQSGTENFKVTDI